MYLTIKHLTNVTYILALVLRYLEKEVQTIWKHSIQ